MLIISLPPSLPFLSLSLTFDSSKEEEAQWHDSESRISRHKELRGEKRFGVWWWWRIVLLKISAPSEVWTHFYNTGKVYTIISLDNGNTFTNWVSKTIDAYLPCHIACHYAKLLRSASDYKATILSRVRWRRTSIVSFSPYVRHYLHVRISQRLIS